MTDQPLLLSIKVLNSRDCPVDVDWSGNIIVFDLRFFKDHSSFCKEGVDQLMQ